MSAMSMRRRFLARAGAATIALIMVGLAPARAASPVRGITIPGTAVSIVLSEFALPTGTPANPFDWKPQDVGSPQFQLEVRGLDVLIDRTKNAGYRFLSVGAKPIQRAFGRFVFAIDPDTVLVEFVEPAATER
jgi:hypothetical protein